MQRTTANALPEGVPPEGLKILKAHSEEELESEFAKWAEKGYVPARRMKVGTHYDEDEGDWKVLYVLPMWKVGSRRLDEESEEMYQ